jgi:hypothetical protein
VITEACGAKVFTARGTIQAIHETFIEPVDLALIDATNIRLEHAELPCGVVKGIRPVECVALLVESERGIPSETRANRVICRRGPCGLLAEVNELLQGRLKLNLWEDQNPHEAEDASSRGLA